jgi:hypothetical protein
LICVNAGEISGIAIRYMPATSLLDRTLMQPGAQSGYQVDFSTGPLWLLRGGPDRL